ncbi:MULTISPECIES: hypothetical protein [unclassified Streptomyces]|uniref:hypothetical protein n=1 Tax=unclassified Streptomyces TaxID=2593676 RepID=UPI0012508077|nr:MULTISPECIES: hypothetical protein [unclassified Streptomyces]KAB2973879.1 hypothetical protein F8R89_18915 [Streptomyces sp. SS1-1]MDI9832210.1 hypothetical protein [Streptomyces sp. KAU_LT]
MFSAPHEGQPRRTGAASPPPTTTPFQAPDFGDDEGVWAEETDDREDDMTAARPQRSGRRGRAA